MARRAGPRDVFSRLNGSLLLSKVDIREVVGELLPELLPSLEEMSLDGLNGYTQDFCDLTVLEVLVEPQLHTPPHLRRELVQRFVQLLRSLLFKNQSQRLGRQVVRDGQRKALIVEQRDLRLLPLLRLPAPDLIQTDMMGDLEDPGVQAGLPSERV